MNIKSPFEGKPTSQWQKITKKLVSMHPLSPDEIVKIVLESWDDIALIKIGKKNYRFGKDIFPKPQIMGFFLHELISIKFADLYPEIWRVEESAGDKDLIYIPNDIYSIEIKTSSNPKSIFGNRSYAQKTTKNKKSKSGYYLAINFEKYTKVIKNPKIVKIRFGWLDHNDWLGQKAASGQQARLSKAVEMNKLLLIYSSE